MYNKRRKMGHRESRHHFSKHAMKTKHVNTMGTPMRGGIRL